MEGRNATACTRSTYWVTFVRQWHAAGVGDDAPADSIPVATDSLHHEVYEMPSGNFLALSTELRQLDHYPSSETDPSAPKETAHVVGGVIVEFTPAGQIVREWKLHDLLDPYRIGYDSLGTRFWRETYSAIVEGETRDWLHDNGIIYDERDDSAVVSLRHGDAVIKVNLSTGELKWILGTPEGLEAPPAGAPASACGRCRVDLPSALADADARRDFALVRQW